MNPAAFANALVLTGPTASGKSAVGLAVAAILNAEIVSMDSMALYRGMDIGTAKPTPAERAGVRHHLIDVLDPWESASLAWWLREAAVCVADIEQRGRRALVVGGTPLYLKGLLHGIFAGPPGDPGLRQRLEAEPLAALHARLAEVDPLTATRLHPHDQRRIVRALEVLELTGQPISTWQQEFARTPVLRARPIWLDLPRAALYSRIDRRVAAMFQAGLVAEVRALQCLPRPLSKEARQALGYKEVLKHLEEQVDVEATRIEVQTRSRNFAKRQVTWFRHLPGCVPLAIAEEEAPEAIAERVLGNW